MTVRLTLKKISKIVTMCENFLCPREFTIREIASLIGTFVGTFPGVEFGPLYYRNIKYDKDTALKSAFGDYEHKMCLSADSRADLKWWVTSLPTAVRHIDHGNPDVTLTTDASHTGLGATAGGNHTQGLWPSSETSHCSINVLELQAGELGLRALLRSDRSVHTNHVRQYDNNYLH